ncbi:uncharacterized protein LOC104417300 isoform X1 [Eucalyptus grandis]|uniref:uncharacterized protein LOC104417300 isoform X1 n=1 Tax=Eucalyptus grandis TaxID=71139 RepID=UPI00192EA079|nr:uncharacterized protein LOC104417300 isoform X1 [Eucalyptus grandis]
MKRSPTLFGCSWSTVVFLQAKGIAETLKNLPLLGLRLNKTDSFRYQARKGRSQKSKTIRPPAIDQDPKQVQLKEKIKAEHVPATLIRIGSWQFASVHEADLVVKFYFATRKLVWEVLENGLKNKMEIQWSDISAIRASIEENKPGILEIELHQPPTFYKESDLQPRHHSNWISADDFTGGQALMYRRHYLEFPSAALDKGYVKLLNTDRRLLKLSQSRFPSGVKNAFYTSQHFNCDEYPPRSAMAMPHAHQVHLRNAYPPALTPQRRQSCEAVMEQARQWNNSTPPMSVLDSQLLENHRLENSQMNPWDQISNNSQLEDLPPLHPAATTAATAVARAGPALYLGEDLYSPYAGEAGVHTLQTPAIMRNPQRQLFFDPISSHDPRLLPAVHGMFPSRLGLPSAIGSASNANAMGARQEHDGYVNSGGQFIFCPLEENTSFTSPTSMPSAVNSASYGVAMGVRQEHDGYANSSGQFIMCPSEQSGTFPSLIGSPSAVGSANTGNAMDGCATTNRQLIFGPLEQNVTFPSSIASYAVGSASHGDAMGVGQEHNAYASSNDQFNFGPSVSEQQIYEHLAPLMHHQAYGRKPQDGSPWK